MNIYVGNLSLEVSPEELQEAFEKFGQVTSVNILKDKFTGQSRGFAFIEMPSKEEAKEAMSSLNSTELKGRYLIINEARPRKDNRSSRHRGGKRGGFR